MPRCRPRLPSERWAHRWAVETEGAEVASVSPRVHVPCSQLGTRHGRQRRRRYAANASTQTLSLCSCSPPCTLAPGHTPWQCKPIRRVGNRHSPVDRQSDWSGTSAVFPPIRRCAKTGPCSAASSVALGLRLTALFSCGKAAAVHLQKRPDRWKSSVKGFVVSISATVTARRTPGGDARARLWQNPPRTTAIPLPICDSEQ